MGPIPIFLGCSLSGPWARKPLRFTVEIHEHHPLPHTHFELGFRTVRHYFIPQSVPVLVNVIVYPLSCKANGAHFGTLRLWAACLRKLTRTNLKKTNSYPPSTCKSTNENTNDAENNDLSLMRSAILFTITDHPWCICLFTYR